LQLVKQAREAGNYYQIVGLADYRLGNWKAARAVLAKGPADPVTAYLLAMTCQRLGDGGKARAYYDQAVHASAAKVLRDLPLESIKAEASQVLGIGRAR
jgi:hypothetical protein